MSEPLDLDAIEQRAAKATAGPWESEVTSEQIYVGPQTGTSDPYDGGLPLVARPVCELYPRKRVGTLDDALFIAAAREDVPRLVEEIRRLRSSRGGESST